MASGYNVHVSLTMDGKSIQGTLNLTEKEMDRFIARTQEQEASGATDRLGASRLRLFLLIAARQKRRAWAMPESGPPRLGRQRG